MSIIREFFDDFLNKTMLFGWDRIGYKVRQPLWDDTELDVDMSGKIAVITGANSGLGYETASFLAGRGAQVHIICRNPDRGKEARDKIAAESGNQNVHLEVLDMGSQKQIRAFVDGFSKRVNKLDILVNNAGMHQNERSANDEGIEKTFAVNTLGYFLLTALLLPLLKQSPGARVINVTSGGMYAKSLNVDDLQYATREYEGVAQYAETKRAAAVMTEVWAEQLKDTNVFVAAMHPGWVDTAILQGGMPGFRNMTAKILRNPRQGADTILWLAANPKLTLADSGKFWFDRKPRPYHILKRTVNTEEEVQSFWRQCSELTGLTESPATTETAATAKV